MRVIVYPSKLIGEQIATASKSSMQRACAAALLHKGKAIIHNPGHSNDDLAAMDVIQKLGAVVAINNTGNKESILAVEETKDTIETAELVENKENIITNSNEDNSKNNDSNSDNNG